ncbi:MAG: holo-[acyl-carrier-protein] synthase [Anaerolineaceae bacterium]|nr:holo-[acyl-carrier-protein] synthase [Anaerolineaceae bacterium]
MAIVGHGVDIIEVERIARMMADHPRRFIARTFTEKEIAFAERRKRGRAEVYAGLFAAKEAVMKALGTGLRRGVAFRDIEVLHKDSGEPHVELHGRTAEVAAERGMARLWISISHIESRATASAIGVDQAG